MLQSFLHQNGAIRPTRQFFRNGSTVVGCIEDGKYGEPDNDGDHDGYQQLDKGESALVFANRPFVAVVHHGNHQLGRLVPEVTGAVVTETLVLVGDDADAITASGMLLADAVAEVEIFTLLITSAAELVPPTAVAIP